MFIAVGHILGSIAASVVFFFMVMLIASWELERNQKRRLLETAIKLGVTVDDLNSEELIPRLLQLSSERFSSDLIKNRVSDLFGVVRTVWGWLGSLLETGVLLGVIWYTITESLDTAVYAWCAVAIAIFFWLASVAFSLVCQFLTGLYPGEARQARKALGEFINLRNSGAE